MNRIFEPYRLGSLNLANRVVFPPIKLAYGTPDGTVTDRQLQFYDQVAKNGPAVIILEPVSVTPEGREHPRQLCVHLPQSAAELQRIVAVIHQNNRLACLHLNHAGAAANPKATGEKPKAPSAVTCPTTGQESEPLSAAGIEAVLGGFTLAARKAAEVGFDLIEIQAGHGYLVSQFASAGINQRTDAYGEDRLKFAREVFAAVKAGAPDLSFWARISGNEMSPQFGVRPEDLHGLLKLIEAEGAVAVHVGMGSACFSPPWYFHHGSLPEGPQNQALAWVRERTSLPVIAAGRMGRKERIQAVLSQGHADLFALGRPLIADSDLLEKWRSGADGDARLCGYCLQGCLHRVKNGEPIGCNLNPTPGLRPLSRSDRPLSVLVAGGGPAGMSAAYYLCKRGHRVTLAEASDHLGGQFDLAWQAPGKQPMQDGLAAIRQAVRECGADVLTGTPVDAALVRDRRPDVLVWATGAVQRMPDIPGLDSQHVLTSLAFFQGKGEVKGPRVLVIGAGRVGLEVVEKLGRQGLEVVATKRTDPIGSHMEMITRNLALKRISELNTVTLMPHTTVREFTAAGVEMEQDGSAVSVPPFQTVIAASGTLAAPGPDEGLRSLVDSVKIIGDAEEPGDIFSATEAGYRLAEAMG